MHVEDSLRSKVTRTWAIVLVLVLGAGCAPGKPARPMSFGIWISEWHPEWSVLRDNPGLYDSVSFSWAHIKKDGSVHRMAPKDRDAIIRWAHGHGIKTYLTFGGGKPDIPVGISGAAGARAIRELVAMCERYGFDGLDSDIEELDGSARAPFTRFLTDLAAAARAMKVPRTLSVTLQEVTNAKDEAASFMDYAAIGRLADTVRMMCYDLSFDEPGPIMSRAGFAADLAFALSRVPAEKFVPAVPWYGRDWNVTDHTQQDILDRMTEKKDGIPGWDEILARYGGRPVWREPEGELSYTYTRDGKRHEVWMADTRQFAWMTDMARKAGVAGVYVWQVEYADPHYATEVRKAFRR